MKSTPPNSIAVSERRKVGMLLPPPLLLLVVAASALALHFVVRESWGTSPRGLVIGTVLVALGIALIAVSGLYFKRSGTPVRPVSPTITIVARGPYAISRNPMYVGMTLLLLGLAFAMSSWIIAVAALFFAAVVHWGVILPEERYLEALHGDTYLRYKLVVRRWL